MKTFSFLMIVIIVSIALTIKSYSAKDTLAPNPVFWFCPNCGRLFEGAYVEDLPRNPDRSNLDSIILQPGSFNYYFSYDDFIPGEDYRTKFYGHVIDYREDACIIITFKDKAGNDTTIQNYCYASKFDIHPDLDFGNVNIGETKELDCWIINNSSRQDTIYNMRLKYENHGFEIIDILFPCIIPFRDSVKFKVRYTATESGVYNDSICVENSRIIAFKSSVKVIAGQPKIEVSHLDFGNVQLFKTVYGNLKIENSGNIPLIITGYKGPNYPSTFIHDLPYISESNPLVIEPNQSFLFNVSFWPTEELSYKDTIIFINNIGVVNTSDSVAELSGRGVIVESVDNLKIENEIELYPNPSDDFLSIKFQDDTRKPDFVRLFDYYGNVVYENRNIDSQNLKIRTSELSSGMYFLKIGNVGIKKVVVVH